MLKTFNDSAKAMFADLVQEAFPDFKLKKSLRGPLAGAANFEHRLSPQKAGWICFGGFKERSFSVLAAWTVSAIGLKELKEWEQYGNPRAFEVPPVPMDGYVDLRDQWRFVRGPNELTWHSLEIEDPPSELALSIFERYVKSAEYAAAVDRQFEGAKRMYTKNMPSFDQVRDRHYSVERNYCVTLWSHLAQRHEFTEDELKLFLRPVVIKAIELVKLHGVPLIEERLAS